MAAPGPANPAQPEPILSALLAPRSVLVVAPAPSGGLIADRLRRFGFAGTVAEAAWPVAGVMPRADLALFDLPAADLPAAIRAAAASGIAAGIAFAAAPANRAPASACAATGFVLLGPGSAGLVSAPARLVAGANDPVEAAEGLGPDSGVALLTQGGRTGMALLRAARKRRWGLRHVIDAGTEARLAVPDLMRALCTDAGTRVIAVCLDRLGPGAGEGLCAALAVARAAGKHVVMLHAGIAEPDRPAPDGLARCVREAILAAEGAIGVESHRELLDVALYLDGVSRHGLPHGGLPAGRRVAIITGGGGGGVIAADLCGHYGLEVPPLAPETREALRPLVPAIASTGNPVDLTPEMFTEKTYDRFPPALDLVAADPGVDAIFLPTTFNTPRGNVVGAELLVAFHRRSPKPVMIGAPGSPDMQPVFGAGGLAPIADTATAAKVLAKLAARAALGDPPPPRAALLAGDAWPAAPDEARAALPRLLAGAGWTLDLPRRTGTSAAALREAAGALPLPLVLTALGVDGGAVPGLAPIDDICDAAELDAARGRLVERAGAGLAGFALRPDLPGTLSLRVTGHRDATFGPVLALGAGGLHARVLDDLAIERAPFGAAIAQAMLARSRAVAHARRMNRALCLDATAEALARLSHLVGAAPWAGFLLRLEPVLLDTEGPRLLDAALVTATDAPDQRGTC
ncbi:MAG: acetate--CoA ligase family protein [Alphaproteobacteria bacterium]|nr:acetate--CoA ligase family protein [Alphaproteobacteria bacterium]